MTKKAFSLTVKQKEDVKLCAGSATHIMGYGGSRSGKTFNRVRNIIIRALKSPKSRHAVLRFRFNHVKTSIILDTFPKVVELCFPGLVHNWNKTDWYVEFANGSQIWFGGLDDKDRTEKILGNEYATIYVNEASQIKSNSTREMLVTRLAQVCFQVVNGEEKPLPLKMYYDCNPPSKLHWTYVIFVKKQDPDSKAPLKNPDDYALIQMNPKDNAENLSDKYIESLQNLSARNKKRFYDGGFSDAMANQLFPDTVIDSYRIIDGILPEMVRVIVAVDPSGAGDEENAHNDAIGIACGGLGIDGKAYLFEDNTVKAGPSTWGGVAVQTYENRKADLIVGEKNYGGEMVRFVIQTCKPGVPFKFVTATRGKTVRAEPFSALYEQGKVCHVGYFTELEDELQGFSTNGYIGNKSPNRADAWIWVLSELFSGMVQDKTDKKIVMAPNGFGW